MRPFTSIIVSPSSRSSWRNELIPLLLCRLDKRGRVLLYLISVVMAEYYAAGVKLGYDRINMVWALRSLLPVDGIDIPLPDLIAHIADGGYNVVVVFAVWAAEGLCAVTQQLFNVCLSYFSSSLRMSATEAGSCAGWVEGWLPTSLPGSDRLYPFPGTYQPKPQRKNVA